MKLELLTQPNETGPTLDVIVGIELSAHNAVQIADRVLRDGKTPTDGLFKKSGRRFIAVTALADEKHYATTSLPSVAERVQFLERLVESASDELARIDRDGLALLQVEQRYREINRRLAHSPNVVGRLG